MKDSFAKDHPVKFEDALSPKPEEPVAEAGKKKHSPVDKFFYSTFASILISTILFGTLFGLSFYIAFGAVNRQKAPTDFAECVKSKGSIIQESYPAVCVARNGTNFTQPLSEEEKRLLEPEPGDAEFCGGIAGVACPEGYTCKLDGSYPDAGGQCMRN